MREIKVKQVCIFDDSFVGQVATLYKQEKFIDENEFNFQAIRRALKNSFCVFGAFADDKLIGIFRALSDGVSDAYLLDLIVENKSRNNGVATALSQSIVRYLHSRNIDWIVCISTPDGKYVHQKIGKEMNNFIPFRFMSTEA